MRFPPFSENCKLAKRDLRWSQKASPQKGFNYRRLGFENDEDFYRRKSAIVLQVDLKIKDNSLQQKNERSG